jgi:capsular polysaccharide biosynthesis protein
VPAGLTLTEAVRGLRERWWVLVLAALLGAAAAFAYTKAPWVEPRYKSSIVIQATGRLDYGSSLALERALRPLAAEIRQRSVMRQVNDNLHTDLPVDDMLAHTKAEPIEDSSQIQVDVEDADAGRAESLASEIANVYVQQHNAAEQAHVREERVILFPLDRPNQAVLVWPQRRLIVPGAALLALLVAAAVLVFGRLLDGTLRYPQQVEAELGLPVLGVVPGMGASARTPLATYDRPLAEPDPRQEPAATGIPARSPDRAGDATEAAR